MRKQNLVKLAVVALLASAVAWFYASGAHENIDPEAVRTWLRQSGAWGGVLFVVAYSCVQPLGINGLVFLLSAPLVWSPTEAFLLNWAGTVGTGITSFSFARFLAKDWVQQRLPKGVRRFDDRLHTHGFRTVLLLRLIFYTTPTLQYALGVSKVRTAPFLAGTVLGVAPFTLLMTLLGVRINEWLDEHPIADWPWEQIGPLLVVAAVLILSLIHI